jgi:hypothetical protein
MVASKEKDERNVMWHVAVGTELDSSHRCDLCRTCDL